MFGKMRREPTMQDDSIVRRFFQLTAEGRQADAAPLLHHDVIVVPSLEPDLQLSFDGFPSYIRTRLYPVAPIHEARANDIQEVAPGRFVVRGRIKMSLAERHGFRDSEAAWAVVVKDGYIFRLKGVATPEQALAVLESDDWSPHRKDESLSPSA
jgi:hypothetical protein